MPPTVFKQPPLVEIIAEFRWDLPNVQATTPELAGAPIPISDGSSSEIQFMNFAGKAGAKGFALVERVVPPGFPLLAQQPAFRYRNTTGIDSAPLFQLGPGIFTINLVPPYKSWASFRPYIDLGLGLLFESRSEEDKNLQFSSVRLRYLDAFGDHLRQGKSIVSFLSQNLGIMVQLPQAITKFCTDPENLKPSFSVSMPIAVGTYELRVGEGWVRNSRSLIMDTAVTCKGPLQPDKFALLDVLDEAHEIIHDSFVGMTQSLHKLMEPEIQG